MGDGFEHHLPPVPQAYRGLWERTLIERDGVAGAGNEQDERVFWLQTENWHADLRIPLDRPTFAGVKALDGCSDAQLGFIARQEGFCGLTKVEGSVCTWLRIHDLRPGTALDVGRMSFVEPDFIIETGISSDYLEHWRKVPGSDGACGVTSAAGELRLQAGRFSMRIRPRPPAPAHANSYAPVETLDRAHLLWRASLEITLLEETRAVLSTHPWLEQEAGSSVIAQVARCA